MGTEMWRGAAIVFFGSEMLLFILVRAGLLPMDEGNEGCLKESPGRGFQRSFRLLFLALLTHFVKILP